MESIMVQSGTIHRIRDALGSRKTRPVELAELALANSNQNAERNVYLWQNAAWTKSEAARVEKMPYGEGGPFGDGHGALWGLPVSVKDCFDLAGSPTTCGTVFYRDHNGIAERDSWLVAKLREAGAVITGKTHLHALAYGITGENLEFGDCIQPRTTDLLTGGSSSGAAASIIEHSAVAAIGTDTGGSVRVPAALCGLVGYRSSLGRGNWNGAAHLAESFDTLGWLFRDLQDAPLLAAPFASSSSSITMKFSRFAYVGNGFLDDCEQEVMAGFHAAIRELEELGLEGREVDAGWWKDSTEIFAPLQASEAACLHAGNFENFEQPIRERLKWGASLSAEEIADLRRRHSEFRGRMDELIATHELVVLPCAPVARLRAVAGDGGVAVRKRLLRYTAPFSLAGVPCVAIPSKSAGIQMAAAREKDEPLLDLAARIGMHRNADAHRSEFQRFWQSIGD
jgi:aspartyl-tRNA(Asn)/glutamyl-tRNA(Gln) amidotransferase subunit A